MTTMLDIINARRFTEAYLGHKFKDNDEFYHKIFKEWWYKLQGRDSQSLGDFLREKFPFRLANIYFRIPETDHKN